MEEKKKIYIPLLLVFLFFGILILIYFLKFDGKGSHSRPDLKERVSYERPVQMTEIKCKAEDGRIKIPLELIKRYKLLLFTYEVSGRSFPILAYITPSGKIVTAISLCEPCRSIRFHIEKDKIICNTCYTEWDLERLKGLKGACLDYPPFEIESVLKDNQILIETGKIEKFSPRIEGFRF